MLGGADEIDEMGGAKRMCSSRVFALISRFLNVLIAWVRRGYSTYLAYDLSLIFYVLTLTLTVGN